MCSQFFITAWLSLADWRCFYFRLGLDHQITLDVKVNSAYTRAGLQCMDPPPTGPPFSSCQSLRSSLPASSRDQSFGERDADVDVTLPRSIYGGQPSIFQVEIHPDSLQH